MGRIQVLTDRVANQIAAGEVVERPASVCKELLENSLDAGAKRLRVDMKSGGRRLLKVSDNGIGMSRDDAMLAFERHATSKLRHPDDLLAIATLGFRGEALPSIASVSRVLLETRTRDDKTGTVVEIHGGSMRDVREDALAEGTSVAIKDLFYNVPARRKFLRTIKTELAHCVRIVTQYSLAHIDKSFVLQNESGELLNVSPVQTLRERVYQVFGPDILAQLVEIEPVEREVPMGAFIQPVYDEQAVDGNGSEYAETSSRKLSLRGFVSEPQVHRVNRNSTYIFVNGRLVRDSLLIKAISGAYENLMPKGVFPFVLLFLDLPPEEVDVNVHPSKTEVRFRNPYGILDFVRDAIRDRLREIKPASGLPQFQSGSTVSDGQFQTPAEVMAGGWKGASQKSSKWSEGGIRQWPNAASGGLGLSGATEYITSAPPVAKPPGSTSLQDFTDVDIQHIDAEDDGHSRLPLVDRKPDTLVDLGSLRLLGQLHESFIAAAGDDGLWIIDQHVAHERILFEKVLAARQHGHYESQQLLMPIMLTLTPDQLVVYEELSEELHANGFDTESFDGRTLAVKSTPTELSARQVETLLIELLENSAFELRSTTRTELQNHMAATIACHAAIKINMRLTPEKMRWLLDALARTDCPMSCPHGRPIALKYGMRDILKAFHRL